MTRDLKYGFVTWLGNSRSWYLPSQSLTKASPKSASTESVNLCYRLEIDYDWQIMKASAPRKVKNIGWFLWIVFLTGRVLGMNSVNGEMGVKFINVAQQAGITAKTVYGDERKNRYLLETTGCG